MDREPDETEFLKHLRSEKLKAEEARTTYTLRKIAYATTLLGLGSLDDHPTRDDYTLIQIRSVHKFEFPACFDVPGAGHVAGLESTTDTLYKELEEELNLDRDDIYDPEMVGSYDYRGPSSDPILRNVEFRVVFRSRLKADRLSRIGFVDREVAAVSVFALSEIEAIINTYPERVASGLTESFPVYLRGKSK